MVALLDRIIKYNKLTDYINIRNFEVKASIFFTLIVIFVLDKINIYSEFVVFEPIVQNILLYIIGGLIGILGFTIAGIALLISLFDRKTRKLIKENSSDDIFIRLLTSFEFLAFTIGIVLVILLITCILISSKIEILSGVSFYMLLCFITYLILFSIFYTISLAGNCVSLFEIKELYEEEDVEYKTLLEEVNEVRSDFLINSIIKTSGMPLDEVIKRLIEFAEVNDGNFQNDVIKYLKDYYEYQNDSK